jgi:Rv2175c C-terminal domain of unknown function
VHQTDIPLPDTGTPHFIPVPDIADRLGVLVTRVHQMIRDRALLGVRSGGVLRVPAEFIDARMVSGATAGVVKGLPGTIRLLSDAGYTDQEIIDWLFAEDDSLPGRPIIALRENRGREVHRRAQAAGF